MKMTLRSSSMPLTLMVVGLVLVGVACKDSNTLVGDGLTPTPTPVLVLAGAWSGTLTPDDGVDCYIVPITATFTQNGDTVDGTLDTSTNGCVPQHITFHGTLAGGTLSGSASGGGQYALYDDHASGQLTPTSLVIEMHSSHLIPGGTAHLHR